ncbi:MAG: FecR domain-containing protein [Pseudomonadota bacterium]
MHKPQQQPFFWLLAAVVVLWAGAAVAAQPSATVAVGGDAALVNYLKGNASVARVKAAPTPLSVGDRLVSGDRVITGTGARIELRLPDGSFLRFDERTTFEVVAAAADQAAKTRDVSVNVIAGKTWAKVARLFGRSGRFELSTPTAVAGVRGTTYRMDVNDDKSAVVKVYEGEVAVSKRTESAAAAAPPVLSKPTPVKGPHPVSMEEWVYLVGALQQININADGSAAKPFRFDIAADLNEWVQWNKLRDGAAGE